MWDITQEAIRYMILVVTNIAAMLMMCDAVMKRRHSYGAVIVLNIIKMVIVNVGIRLYLAEVLAISSALQLVYFTLVVLFAVLNYAVFVYTFDEDFAKIAIICSVAEMGTFLVGNSSLALFNAINRMPLLSVQGPVQVTDPLIPVVALAIIYGIRKAGSPLWRRLRTWEVKHKKEIMVIFVIYLAFSIIGMQNQFDEQSVFIFVMYAIIGPYALMSYVNYFYRRTQWENEMLKKQQAMMRMQYEAVGLQIEKIEQMHEEIRMQMETILAMSDQADNKSEQIVKYVESLKNHSQQIKTGIFCDDWYLDAVLYEGMKCCQKKGIKTDFSLAGYSGTAKQNELLARELQKAIQNACDAARETVMLRVSTVKNQVLIKLECDEKAKAWIWKEKNKHKWQKLRHFW